MVFPEIIDRLDNWRRFYKTVQVLHTVPYYTPPEAGDVFEEERFTRIPIEVHDAMFLEFTWRVLDNQGYKHYIKYEYIHRMKPQAMWRKLKPFGLKLRSYEEHDSINRLALEYFIRNLDHAKSQGFNK